MENAITLRENAKQQLMEIKTVDVAAEYVNKLKAMEVYIKASQQDAELVKMVQEQRIRATRLAGKMLLDSDVSKNANPKKSLVTVDDQTPTLSDLGITKNESSTYQKIASIPEDVFEAEMEKAKEGDSTTDITTSRFKRLAGQENRENKLSEKMHNEKQLKKYATLLGFKVAVLNPDLLIVHKHSKDVDNIKLMYNQN